MLFMTVVYTSAELCESIHMSSICLFIGNHLNFLKYQSLEKPKNFIGNTAAIILFQFKNYSIETSTYVTVVRLHLYMLYFFLFLIYFKIDKLHICFVPETVNSINSYFFIVNHMLNRFFCTFVLA